MRGLTKRGKSSRRLEPATQYREGVADFLRPATVRSDSRSCHCELAFRSLDYHIYIAGRSIRP